MIARYLLNMMSLRGCELLVFVNCVVLENALVCKAQESNE